MRLVRIRRAVWDLLAIADEMRHSVWDELEAADPSDTAAERMRATLETDVPLNGPPLMNRTRCRHLGGEIYEFKEHGWRVLWFYDTKPGQRRRIICTHSSPKVSKKEFQPEIARARRIRKEYVAAKATGRLIEPEE
ncbi:MAG TPA: hypothetical protein VHR45_07085 [Thermoanaerobaculia bacterium]|nr:hypothetical protein [Thermoanaerobaculia bacterium]